MWALQRVAPSRYASGVSPFLRKVKTASGATAVQIAIREGRRDKVIEHLGSAYDDAELAVLLEPGRPKLHPGQMTLDLGVVETPPAALATTVVTGTRTRIVADVITAAYEQLGFTGLDDEGCFQLVLARLEAT
nr:hypothetical protein [Kocuria marina]